MSSKTLHGAVFLFVTLCFAGFVQAQEPGKLQPLPDRFPQSIEARIGPVDFKNGLPT
jgi:hypothetical protein